MAKKLFLFDAYALIYRAYYAFLSRPMINSKGQNTSAIYGFTTTLLDVLRRENPDYLAVAFDPPSPTFRNQLYPEYKANRQSTPEEIRKSVPIIKQILNAFRIPILEVPGYEADDVIGTFAKQAEETSLITYMVTPDKDYSQLVSDHIFVYRPSRQSKGYEILGPEQVKEQFGVEPIHVIDILALWGDASDNIPGAPGIGEKTAKELIGKFGSLDQLWDRLQELKPKQKENLTQFREQVMLSQTLATINLQVPLSFNLGDLEAKSWDEKQLRSIFTELEFRSLMTHLTESRTNPLQTTLFAVPEHGKETIADSYAHAATTKHRYHLVTGQRDLENLVQVLSNQSIFCFDSETTGLNTREAELVGLSFSWENHEAYYVPIPPERTEAQAILEMLRPVWANPAIKKVGQNLKYDLKVLMNYNMPVRGEMFDTMIAHYLIQPDLSHNMDYLSEVYLHYKPIAIKELIGEKGPHQKNMRDVPVEQIKEYAAEDADITWQLYGILSKELEKFGLKDLAYRVEMPLVNVLAEMEFDGFRLSVDTLTAYSVLLREEIGRCEKTIFEMAGTSFNLNSPRQLGEILFERMHISEGTPKTKTNQYSTSEEVLAKLADVHPVVNMILDYRAMQKLLNTYVDALPQMIDTATGKIHTSFDQAWVSTGRLSSKGPNLQNIPVRDERGREIRKAFIASDSDHVLLSADYSQIELRLMAHLSGDRNMIEAFNHQEDIHTATAAKIFKVPENEVTSAMRSKAKTANFGIIYGISAFGLSQRLNISRAEATSLIQGYFESYPDVRLYMDKAIHMAKEKGFVETLMGRRRYLPDIRSANATVRGMAERNAINAPIQGSAADIIKLAMVNIQRQLRENYRTRMILQVHDELIFDVQHEELEAITQLVRHEMEHACLLQVPLLVDIGTGKNWLEAH